MGVGLADHPHGAGQRVKGLLLTLALGLLRFYYPLRAQRGVVPAEGPCIVVANHPNGLLDPVLLRLALDRPLAFLAKHTLFSMPFLGGALAAFDAIPVFRAKEGDTSRNKETFARARAILHGKGWLALFPEGVSHDAPELQDLKTGAARIALGGPDGLVIVPVGLTYATKTTFRSAVTLAVGAPIEVAAYRTQAVPDGGEPGREDVTRLTEALREALRAQVLEAEDAALWHGFRAVSAWLATPGEDASATDARARQLSAAWRDAPPWERETLADEARAFAARLDAVGVQDPLLLEAGLPDAGGVLGAIAPLVLLAPFALVGTLLGWLPYRGAGELAAFATDDPDQLATYKLLAGCLLVPLGWFVVAGTAATFVGAGTALGVLLLGPTCGYVALRWDERLTRRRALGRAWTLLLTEAGVAETLRDERKRLADRVAEVLARPGAVDATVRG